MIGDLTSLEADQIERLRVDFIFRVNARVDLGKAWVREWTPRPCPKDWDEIRSFQVG